MFLKRAGVSVLYSAVTAFSKSTYLTVLHSIKRSLLNVRMWNPYSLTCTDQPALNLNSPPNMLCDWTIPVYIRCPLAYIAAIYAEWGVKMEMYKFVVLLFFTNIPAILVNKTNHNCVITQSVFMCIKLWTSLSFCHFSQYLFWLILLNIVTSVTFERSEKWLHCLIYYVCNACRPTTIIHFNKREQGNCLTFFLNDLIAQFQMFVHHFV